VQLQEVFLRDLEMKFENLLHLHLHLQRYNPLGHFLRLL
jgi:hypothetical protein